jgi:hypothetical protein
MYQFALRSLFAALILKGDEVDGSQDHARYHTNGTNYSLDTSLAVCFRERRRDQIWAADQPQLEDRIYPTFGG